MMLTEDLLEKYLVLDQLDSVSIKQLNEVEITESHMDEIRKYSKITQVMSDYEANEAILNSNKQKLQTKTTRWNKEESKLFVWIMAKMFVQEQFCFSNIPKYIWDQAASYLFKTPFQVEKKWQEYKMHSVTQFTPWSNEEDQVLSQLVSYHKQFQTKLSWTCIGKEFNEQIHVTFRTGKKCRDRWLNVLDPSIVNKKWRDEDTQELLKYVTAFGKKWFKIAAIMQRTENLVKNKYYGLIKKYQTLEKCLKMTKNRLNYKQQMYQIKEYSESITENLEMGFYDLEKKIVILCDWKEYYKLEEALDKEIPNK